jgi:hypothetical protein
MAKLKPCPFCGQPVRIETYFRRVSICHFPDSKKDCIIARNNELRNYHSKNKATKVWNKRSNSINKKEK